MKNPPDQLSKHPVFKEFTQILTELKDGSLKETQINGLWGSPRAFFSQFLIQQWQGQVLFLAPTISEAERFYNDLMFFIHRDKPDQEIQLKSSPASDDSSLVGHDGYSIDQDNLSEPVLLFHDDVMIYPPWELLPLEVMSPYEAISHRRLVTHYTFRQQRTKAIVTTPDALMKKNIPGSLIDDSSFSLELYQEYDRDKLTDILHNIGYHHVDIIEATGQFAVRGGVLDISVPLFKNPIRIEFIGDQIESIREFEIESQRSLSQLLAINVIPAREFIYSNTAISSALERINQLQLESETKLYALDELAERIEQRHFYEGIEWYQPFFYTELEPFLDQFNEDTLVVFLDKAAIQRKIHDFDTLLRGQFRHYRAWSYPYFPLEVFYQTESELTAKLFDFPVLHFSLFSDSDFTDHQFEIHPQSIPAFNNNIERALVFLKKAISQKHSILLLYRTAAELQVIKRALEEFDLSEEAEEVRPDELFMSDLIEIEQGELSQGFMIPELHLVIVSPLELFQEKSRRITLPRYRGDELIASFRDLKRGDFVVHVDHGIGRYLGTQEITVEMVTRDFLILEYADNDKLFLPMDRINLIQRYSSSENAITISVDKLGSTRWNKVKEKVKESIREMAMELIELYASREVMSGFKYPPDDHWQNEFDAAFPFDETPDQLQAIDDVKNDMEQDDPMDRLICGDVGFGKTEVAMRAAFKAVMNNYQVAVLAPTTILAQQHYLTFSERCEPFPIHVDVLSRFRTQKEQKEIIENVAKGTIDILVGTHRVLQKDLQFKNLGLIVVDEEQRFGVSHKEKLKQLRKKADVLTMTATPIPRTLHMAISGLRDMSIINTPPENRLAIHTKVMKFNPGIIKEAIIREIQRGGQVYFVHNRVRTIYSMAHFLKKLLPDVSFCVAHGQMKEGQLKKIMHDFVNKKFDVLVSTTIIESGIDIPSVNTMLINRADKLGLAQLYQLRGRVGRAHHRAFCYLLIPDPRLLNRVAQQRLKVIQELTDLGSGFRIAAHDLEIRGAGNLLGAQQHGHINAVGFDLYCSLLEKAVRELKGEKQKKEITTTVTIPLEAYIPQTFIPDTNQRLMIYRKLATIGNQLELREFAEELRDRFGVLPIVVQRLIDLRSFNLDCNIVGIERLEIGKGSCIIHFAEKVLYSPEDLIEIAVQHSVTITFPSSYAAKLGFSNKSIVQIYAIMQTVVKEMIFRIESEEVTT